MFFCRTFKKTGGLSKRILSAILVAAITVGLFSISPATNAKAATPLLLSPAKDTDAVQANIKVSVVNNNNTSGHQALPDSDSNVGWKSNTTQFHATEHRSAWWAIDLGSPKRITSTEMTATVTAANVAADVVGSKYKILIPGNSKSTDAWAELSGFSNAPSNTNIDGAKFNYQTNNNWVSIGEYTLQASGVTSGIEADLSNETIVTQYIMFYMVLAAKAPTTRAASIGLQNIKIYGYDSQPQVAMPTATPAAGTYTGAQVVSLQTTTPGASIYYTLDGTTPTSGAGLGILYTNPITVTQTTTINAISAMNGMADSDMASFDYTIHNPDQVDSPEFSPTPGHGALYHEPLQLTLSTPTAGASIYYTLDGVTTPTSGGALSVLYTMPITLSGTTTVKAMAVKTGMLDSSVGSHLYTFKAARPAFGTAGGWYQTAQTVTLTSDTPGARIYYTTDGTEPTKNSQSVDSGGSVIVSQTGALKAFAVKDGMTDSDIASVDYIISADDPDNAFFGNWALKSRWDTDVKVSTQGTTSAAVSNNDEIKYLLVDGNLATFWGTRFGQALVAEGYRQWAAIDLKKQRPFNVIKFSTLNLNKKLAGYSVWYTNSDEAYNELQMGAASPVADRSGTKDPTKTAIGATAWVKLGESSRTPQDSTTYKHSFDTINARYVLLLLENVSEPTLTDTSGNPVRIAELEVIRIDPSLPVLEKATTSLAAGSYWSPQTITLSSSVPGAKIYYTTDGSAPITEGTTQSPLYNSPITIDKTMIVKAVVTAANYTESPIAEFIYRINTRPPLDPPNPVERVLLDPSMVGPASITSADIPQPGSGSTVYVANSTDLSNAIKTAAPGDTIILSDGNYTSGISVTAAKGTAASPILIKAQNVGGAVFTNTGISLNITNSEYLTFDGIRFETYEDTSLQLSGCNNIRITRSTFKPRRDNLDPTFDVKTVVLKPGTNVPSFNNRIDHSFFDGKVEKGQTISMTGSTENGVIMMTMYDRIDHNYFKNIGPRISNGMETIRVGVGNYSSANAFALIEYNLFENADGDPEVVSLKSNDNVVRFNTFLNCQSQVTFRQSDRSQVYGNIFMGDGIKQGVGGIRSYGMYNKVFSNYFQGLTWPAIQIDTASWDQGYEGNYIVDSTEINPDADDSDDESAAGSKHWRNYFTEATDNVIINSVVGIDLSAKWTSDRRFGAVDTKIIGNTIVTNSLTGVLVDNVPVFTATGTPPQFVPAVGTVYQNNTVWSTVDNLTPDKILKSGEAVAGFTIQNPGYALQANGMYAPAEIVAAPVANPAGGSFSGTQAVALTCATPGATIFYTTDGTAPVVSGANKSAVYSSAINVGTTLTIKAIAVKAGMADSAILIQNYTINTPTATPTPTPTPAPPSGSSSSGNDSDSGTTVYQPPFTNYQPSAAPAVSANAPTNVVIEAAPAVQVTSAGDSAVVSVNKAHVDLLLVEANAAISSGKSPEITIAVPAVSNEGGLSTVTALIPGDGFSQLAQNPQVKLSIDTPIATITFNGAALNAVSNTFASGDVAITVAMADTSGLPDNVKEMLNGKPVYEFNIQAGGRTVSEFGEDKGGSVTVKVPYTLAEGEEPQSIVAYYIATDGSLKTQWGFYDEGHVVFNTAHFSKYAIGHNNISFKDVLPTDWFYYPVEFVAARGIASGVGNDLFAPGERLTRAQALVMLMKTYGIEPVKNPSASSNFADAGDTYYTGYLAAAKAMAIANGVGDNKFDPNGYVRKQDLFTMMYNMLSVMKKLPKQSYDGKPLSAYTDAGQIDTYARAAVEYFSAANIANGLDNLMEPKSYTTRAQMASVLYELIIR